MAKLKRSLINGDNYIEDYCRIWALPYVIPCVTPLCPIGGAPNMWNKEGFEKGGTTGVPLYSLVTAAGEEAIFYPDGLDFMPYDVSHDDDPSVSGGWTYFEILNRGLTLDQTFPRLDQGPCDINIYKDFWSQEILDILDGKINDFYKNKLSLNVQYTKWNYNVVLDSNAILINDLSNDNEFIQIIKKELDKIYDTSKIRYFECVLHLF